ncbi:MAG: hypothetical protein NXI10_15600 [bacterium]|nr:hypothetical protein [bacterium]
MNTILACLFSTLVITFVSAQNGVWDTTAVVDMGNGTTLIIAESFEDTVHSIYTSQGKLESRTYFASGVYERYYENGKTMWQQERKNDRANGEMKFFDPNGTHVGTLALKNDTITDTLFLHLSKTIVFGRWTYSSVVHGGMRRPDGTSNISRASGQKIFSKMYAVKHDKVEPAKKYAEFSTDAYGFFFFMAEEGSFGIFSAHNPLEDVTPEMGTMLPRKGSSVHTTWSVSGPIQVSNNFCYLPYHVHSVGYAP